MTRDDILRMAREAGLAHFYDSEGDLTGITDARLVDEDKHRNDERLVEILGPLITLVTAAKDAEHQQTLALQQRSYEREIRLEVEAERERIIQFLREMQRQVGDAHNHYGHAAVRIKEGV